MGVRETKRDGKHLQCPECKHKVDWEDTPYAEEEAKKQAQEAKEAAEAAAKLRSENQ